MNHWSGFGRVEETQARRHVVGNADAVVPPEGLVTSSGLFVRGIQKIPQAPGMHILEGYAFQLRTKADDSDNIRVSNLTEKSHLQIERPISAITRDVVESSFERHNKHFIYLLLEIVLR